MLGNSGTKESDEGEEEKTIEFVYRLNQLNYENKIAINSKNRWQRSREIKVNPKVNETHNRYEVTGRKCCREHEKTAHKIHEVFFVQGFFLS